MRNKKPPKRGARVVRKFFAELRPGERLTLEQCIVLNKIGNLIAEGRYDALSKYCQVAPKRGRPPETRELQKWAASAYLRLRIDEPDKPKKLHAGLVADLLKVSDSRAAAIIRAHRPEGQPLARMFSLKSIMWTMLACLPDTGLRITRRGKVEVARVTREGKVEVVRVTRGGKVEVAHVTREGKVQVVRGPSLLKQLLIDRN